MLWVRQNLVAILFGAMVLLQSVSVILHWRSLEAIHETHYVRISNTRDIAESIGDWSDRHPVKISICDDRGRDCVSTNLVYSRNLGISSSYHGLVVADPERKN